VYLRLQPYRKGSQVIRRALKLSHRFYGPFIVIRKVGEVAYELSLPVNARIHLVFHVSQLMPKIGSNNVAVPTLPLMNGDGITQPEPVALLVRRSRVQDNKAITEVLIRWKGQSPEDATWEEYHALKRAYPHLVGKVF
jgi:hypothetical protein